MTQHFSHTLFIINTNLFQLNLIIFLSIDHFLSLITTLNYANLTISHPNSFFNYFILTGKKID